MAIERYIDIVYRSPVITGDGATMLMNKTVHSVVMDGFNFQESVAAASSHASTIIVYAFNNTSPRQAVADADHSVTYTDIVRHPFQEVYPRLHGKQFIVEWRYGVDKNADSRVFIDFFGNAGLRVIPYTRRIAGR